jgi:hypothetical protein
VSVVLADQYGLDAKDSKALNLAVGRVRCVVGGAIKSIKTKGLHVDIVWIGEGFVTHGATNTAQTTSRSPTPFTSVSLAAIDAHPRLPIALVDLGVPIAQDHGGRTIENECLGIWPNEKVARGRETVSTYYVPLAVY